MEGAPTSTAPQRRVLVVDDDVATVRLLAIFLTELGRYRVVEETSAPAVIDRVLTGERFDAIISDIAMPEMSGCELHRELSRVARDQADRMIFMSGALRGDEAAYVRGLSNVWLAKPFDADILRVALRKLVRTAERATR